MLNRPFSSANISIFDEKIQNTNPARICGHNVLVSREHHQKVFNTHTTSIAGMPGNYPSTYQNAQNYNFPYQTPQDYSLMHQNYPNNAVTFTFGGNQGQPQFQQPYWQCQSYTNPAMQSMNQLQQMNAFDLMQIQNQLNQPYQWRFHLDNQTSTTDLAKSVVRPQLSNLSGILKSRWPYWLSTPLSRNHKKLILKHVTAKLEGGICDGLDLDHDKLVSFNLDDKNTVGTQAKLCCTSCCHHDENHNEENKAPETQKTPKRRKKKGKKTTPPSSDLSNDEDFEDSRR